MSKLYLLFFLFISVSLVSAQKVRISEIHYDNVSSDTLEGVEVTGFAGVNLNGWKIHFYNGTNGTEYTPSISLSGIIPNESSSGVGAVWFLKSNIQNGPPDGMALVDPLGNVIEFLSYEGSFTATIGPAKDLISTNIGVSETGTTPKTHSLQRTGLNSWVGPLANTHNLINAGFNTSILPVTLSKLTLSKIDNKPALSWTTASESNNSHFEINHSNNGIDFKKVGTVDAHNTRSNEKAYQFKHNSFIDGLNYYKLTQVDMDGTKTDFKILSLQMKSIKLMVYPTATNDVLYINQSQFGKNLSVYNTSGALILNFFSASQLDVSFLSKGMYFVKIENEIHKFFKL